MISPVHARTMAAYNRWMNERLYELCAALPDAERKRDRGAFFRSVHGTLNHLLYGDRAWMSRFTARDLGWRGPADELYADFAELRAARAGLDHLIENWAARLDESWLAAVNRGTPIVDMIRTDSRMRDALGAQAPRH